MSRLLLRRKSSIKSNIKPIPSVKEPKKASAVEFRWSTTAAQYGFTETNSSMNFHLIDLDSSEQKAFLPSPSSTTRNPATNRSSFSIEKPSLCSPRLPNINNIDKEQELSTSTDTNPLSLPYSQLDHTQNFSRTKKISICPLINNKQNNTHLSQSSSTNNKYIRLQTSQLRRLNVSNKYMKEAKKLYFNATSKVFVPRHSIVQIS